MKIGIITYFRESTNYGAVLQAYALTKKLEKLGYDTEQILYVANLKNLNCTINEKSRTRRKFTIKRCVNAVKTRIRRFKLNLQIKGNKIRTKNKQKCFKDWTDENVISSAKIYTCQNINESLDTYDCFITGSDQVWNYNWYDKNYFLDFVDKSKIKMSYAASMGHDIIPKNVEEIFKNHLKSFNSISVREENMVELLQPLSPTKVEWVLDPVFLLEKSDWDDVASKNKYETVKYIFCYFLGDNKKERQIARKYAKKRNLKVVTIKDLLIEYNRRMDETFANIKLENVHPGGFLSLIKNAECVFTDSFHATAFSLIYKKQFFVFNRYKNGEMNERIKSILSVFKANDRFCEREKEDFIFVNNLENIDYLNNQEEFENLKKQSVKFLVNSLGGSF